MSNRNVEDIYELSPLQEGMLYHHVLDPGVPMYVYEWAFELRGQIDLDRIEQVANRLIQRHTILRTSFHYEDLEKPVQVVHRTAKLPLEFHDYRGRQPAEIDELIRALCQDALFFDLTRAPLMKLTVVQTDDEVHQLVWVFHHIILDAWSIPLLVNELLTLYGALLSGEEIDLPPMRPFRDFIDWLQRRDPSEDERFWRAELAGFSSPTQLSVRQHARRVSGDVDFCGMSVAFSQEKTELLRAFAREHQTSLSTLVHAAWGLLLARYSGQDDVVFGMSALGRPPELDGIDLMVGMFINTNPLRIRVPRRTTVRAWLGEVHARLMDVRKHEHSPLVNVRQWSEVPQDGPLFESMFVLENFPSRGAQELFVSGAAQIRSFSGGGTRVGYPLVATVWHEPVISFSVGYDRNRFDGLGLERMAEHFKVILESMPAYADRPLHELPLLTDDERQLLLAQWSGAEQQGAECFAEDKAATSQPFSATGGSATHDVGHDDAGDVSIPQLFQEQVTHAPGAVAVVCGDRQLSYDELNQLSNQLAHRLRDMGAGPEVLVGLYLERSVETIVGLMGILKSGAAYVPFDPDSPRARLATMLNVAHIDIVVTQESLQARLPLDKRHRVVCLDSDEQLATASSENPNSTIHGDHPAYVILTSGSTGTPNAVLVPHRALAHYARYAADKFALSSSDCILQFASISFDAAAEEIFPALICQSKLVIRTVDMLKSVDAFLDACDDARITVLDLPTSYWHEVAAELADQNVKLPDLLRLVIIGGERARPDRLRQWQRSAPSCVKLLNTYGPTEATIVATVWDEGDDAAACSNPLSEVPIGKPIRDVRIYVLDGQLNPVPTGVAGELYIGGAGLARGYLRRSGLTAERFIPDPYGREVGQRLYRTGDLCRWLRDGTLEFCGRTDHQIKLRGYRLELGEIENTLLQHPSVRDAAVVLRDDDTPARLAAYVIPATSEAASDDELRSYLHEQLPDYAVPTWMVTLASFPRTPSGKIDRRSLPTPGEALEAARPFRAPSTEIEAAVGRVIAETLNLDEISVDANFFALGGNSLLAIRVWSRLNEMFDVDLPLRTFVETATAEGIALAIEETLLCEIEALADDEVEALQESQE